MQRQQLTQGSFIVFSSCVVFCTFFNQASNALISNLKRANHMHKLLERESWKGFQTVYVESWGKVHFFFFEDFIYFLEKGREEEWEGEKYQCVVASHALATRDLAGNLVMCPSWESNWRPLDSQAGTQSLSHTCQGSHPIWMYYIFGWEKWKTTYFIERIWSINFD